MSREFVEIRLSKQPPIRCYNLECPVISDLLVPVDRANLKIAVRAKGSRVVVYGVFSPPEDIARYEGVVCTMDAVWTAAVTVLQLLTAGQSKVTSEHITRWAGELIQNMPSVEIDQCKLDIDSPRC